jgi:hypothetical protein
VADHTELLAGLRSLGRDLDLPAADPAAAATARIRAAGGDRTAPPGAVVSIGGSSTRRRWLLAAAAAVVALAVVLALPGPRRVAARLLGIGAIQISTTGDVPPGAAVTELGNLGAPAPVDEAVERSAGAFGDPPVPGLDAPDRAYVGTEAVTLVWDASDRLPELGTTGAGLVVTALRGPGGEPALRKETSPGTRVTAVSVAGHPGYWVSGASHRVGERTAGNVLIWADGPVTYRLESALTKDAAIRVGAAI